MRDEEGSQVEERRSESFYWRSLRFHTRSGATSVFPFSSSPSRFPLLFLCSLFFISPLESGQGSSLFSFFYYSRSSFNKRHTHKDAYCTLSALGSPAASSHAETHKFYLTDGRTPFRLPPCHLRLTETSCDALRHAIKTGLFPLCGSQVNGSERSWLVSGPAWRRIRLISGACRHTKKA